MAEPASIWLSFRDATCSTRVSPTSREISAEPGDGRFHAFRHPMPVKALGAATRPGAAARGVLGLIRAYQVVFSPMYAGSCRFVPSCSQYAREAVEKFGAVRGSWLAVRRLMRCHPLGSSGIDPVPD